MELRKTIFTETNRWKSAGDDSGRSDWDFILVCAGCVGIFLYAMKRQRKQIEELEQYCEEVLQETATLDLRDNEEGRFSLLKNKVYDITVLLREKNQLLEKNKKETERLIADISHQLKTPITSLRMTNEILYMDMSSEKRMRFLDNMQADLLKIEWFVKNDFEPCKIRFKDTYIEKEKRRWQQNCQRR